MLVLGLLLIIGAALVAVGAVYDAGEEATVEILGQTVTTTAAGVFVAGAVTMLMFLIGVWALMASMGRSRRKRAERKAAKARHRDSVSRLEEERAALRAENERLAEQLASGRQATTGPAAAGAAGATTGSGVATHDEGADPVHPAQHETGHPHETGHDDRSSAHRLMDRVTGRRHDTAASHDTAATHDTTRVHDSSATPDADAHQSDRVIDHDTDLTSQETPTSGHHRDTL